MLIYRASTSANPTRRRGEVAAEDMGAVEENPARGSLEVEDEIQTPSHYHRARPNRCEGTSWLSSARWLSIRHSQFRQGRSVDNSQPQQLLLASLVGEVGNRLPHLLLLLPRPHRKPPPTSP